jgi:hypothetical protein
MRPNNALERTGSIVGRVFPRHRLRGGPLNSVVRGLRVRINLVALHPVVMILAVVVAWFIAAFVVLEFLSAVNAPGINEHGPGAIYALAGIIVATLGALATVIIVLLRRVSSKRAAASHEKTSNGPTPAL